MWAPRGKSGLEFPRSAQRDKVEWSFEKTLFVFALDRMNTIEAIVGNSEFVSEPHLMFVIDGVSLDKILSVAHPDKNLAGLIPTTLNWLENEKEQNEVWARFTNRKAERLLIPLLCCPDDLDFSCTIVVVDANFDNDTVHWLKFGIDATPSHRLPSAIGSTAHWLSGVGPYKFDRGAYDEMAQAFQRRQPPTDVAG